MEDILISQFESVLRKEDELKTTIKINKDSIQVLLKEIETELANTGFSSRDEIQAEIERLSKEIRGLLAQAEKALA